MSAGCAHCYAETLSGRNPKTLGIWGPKGTRVVAAESAWREPLKWDRQAKAAGERHRVFCASLADVFEGPETMPEAAVDAVRSARMRLFNLIDATPNLDWLLLTKRPQNVVGIWNDGHSELLDKPWPANVWLGTSVENQAAADERIPELLKVPAAVRFLSCEPLLGPLDLRPKAPDAYGDLGRLYRHVDPGDFAPASDRVINCFPKIDWVIVGGESGSGARPMNVKWAGSLVEQCKAAGTKVFVKQLGGHPYRQAVGTGNPVEPLFPMTVVDKKGGDLNEFPADLRVREFPSAAG